MKHQLFIPKVFSTSTPTSRPTNEPEFDDTLPSPASTVASVTRELEDTLQTLDLHTAMRGQYVVKPQVNFTIFSQFVYQLEAFMSLDSAGYAKFCAFFQTRLMRILSLRWNKI